MATAIRAFDTDVWTFRGAMGKQSKSASWMMLQQLEDEGREGVGID